MLVKRVGGMTEFIPSPTEKRDGVIHNHVLDLLVNLDARIRQLEHVADLTADLADQFSDAMARIRSEEEHVQRLNNILLDSVFYHKSYLTK